MQRLVVSGAVRLIYRSLGVKGLMKTIEVVVAIPQILHLRTLGSQIPHY